MVKVFSIGCKQKLLVEFVLNYLNYMVDFNACNVYK